MSLLLWVIPRPEIGLKIMGLGPITGGLPPGSPREDKNGIRRKNGMRSGQVGGWESQSPGLPLGLGRGGWTGSAGERGAAVHGWVRGRRALGVKRWGAAAALRVWPSNGSGQGPGRRWPTGPWLPELLCRFRACTGVGRAGGKPRSGDPSRLDAGGGRGGGAGSRRRQCPK